MRSLRIKIGLGFFVIVGISIATGVLVLVNVQALRDEMERVTRTRYGALIAAENMVKAVQLHESAHFTMLVQDVDMGRMMLNENRDRFLAWYDRAYRSSVDTDRPTLDSLFATYRDYLGTVDSLQVMLEAHRPMALLRDFQFFVIRPLAERLKELSFHVLDQSQNAIVRANREAEESAKQSAFIIIGAAAINLALSLIAALSTTRTVVRPLLRLTNSVRAIGSGRLDQKIDVSSNDEIGVLSVEFNKMTERLRAFEQLNINAIISEKTRGEAILESISDPIIVTNEAGAVLRMNHAARALALLDAGTDVTTRPLADVLPDESWARHVGPHEPERDLSHEDFLQLERDGHVSYYRPVRRAVKGGGGAMAGVVTLFQDVTRFKQIQQMKSDFLAAVSHEFRTPLTSISMTVDILQQGLLGPLNERQTDLLEGAKTDTERLKKLVEELLALSKLESARGSVAADPVSLRRVVEDSLRPLRHPIAEKGLDIRVEIADTVPDVRGDFQQLCWVLVNLLSNGVRYSPAGGLLRVSARREGRQVLVAIADQGRGIAAEDLESIFDKFVQIKHPDDVTPGSIGLGLTIARQVVDNHGGRIWAESAPGAGSTFCFTLPVAEEGA